MSDTATRFRRLSLWLTFCSLGVVILTTGSFSLADEEKQPTGPPIAQPPVPPPAAEEPKEQPADQPEEKPAKKATPQLELKELFEAGGVIGIIILALSVAMVALIMEHLFSIRRSALMPPGMAEEVHRAIGQQRFQDAEQTCRNRNSFLGHVLAAGLGEVSLGYSAVEKAMEDASVQQAARLFRKIEYLSVIGTIAPMLGLLGTVWGIMQAFLQFSVKANPQVSELAPGIYKALVTTLLGLSVAVPALASFAIMRNRIDEYVAEASLLAERVFLDFKRSLASRKKKAATTAPKRRTPHPDVVPQSHSPSIQIHRKD